MSARVPLPPGASRSADAGASDGGGVGAGTYRRLLGYLTPYRGLFLLSLLSMVLSALLDAFSLILIIPFLRSLFDMGPLLPGGGRNAVERLIDRVAGGWLTEASGLDALLGVCLLILVAILLKNVFLYVAKLLSIHVQERIERDMRDQVHGHLQRLPLGFFDRSKAGQLIARVLTDTRETKQIVSFTLAEALRHLVTVLAYMAALLFLSWRLTLLALVLAPLLVLALRPVLRRLRSGFRRVYDEQGELLSVLQETVSGIRLVKAYGAEEHEERRFRDRSEGYTRGLIRTQAISQLASPLSETLSAFVALALIWIGASMVLEAGVLGPEQFLAFVTIALRMISPIKALAQFPARAQQSLAASDRFFEILDTRPEPVPPRVAAPAAGEAAAPGEEASATGKGASVVGGEAAATGKEAAAAGGEAAAVPGGREVRDFRDAIRFENVSFSYEEDRPVLRDVRLEVRKGEVVALVGPSGAGKSTLVDLLPRFIEPDRGRILLDGTDLRELSLASLRNLMGIVSQETVIFHDTVRANIAYGSPSYSDEEVEVAARAANAHDFILRDLPEGYETLLGDRGVRLSGGQRQRIGIARAILRDPPILILDEATSNLDTESERLIQVALDRLLEGRTVFVIAHRLSTVRGADRILVLENGEIVERGTHAELHARPGLYRRLYDLQLAGEAAV